MITVTAQRTEEDRQEVPVSVTAVSGEAIERAGFRRVSDVVLHAPNVFYTEFTARKLSTARVRGVGSSPNNPGVTTYIDGVPQLNESSASLELLDVGQIEFVRGPQGALFGRNTLGGLVNVTTARPSLDSWTGTLSAPFGNYGAWAVRGGASGPVVPDRLSLGVSFAEVNRDGFTVNDVTGRDIDSRSAFSSKAQLLWTPSSTWETRFIVTSERSRDGDFAGRYAPCRFTRRATSKGAPTAMCWARPSRCGTVATPLSLPARRGSSTGRRETERISTTPPCRW